MSETSTTTPQKGKIASFGGAEPIQLSDLTGKKPVVPDTKGENNNGNPGGEGTVVTELTKNEGESDADFEARKLAAKDNNQQSTEPVLTDEQIKAEYEKRFANKGESQETPEQKAQREAALEKRMHDQYVANGGKGSDFYEIKRAAEADLTTLSQEELHFELKQKGFSDDMINEIQKERYYQLNPDEVVQDIENGETDEQFAARKEMLKKKVELGTELFNRRGERLKKNAQSILDTLKTSIEHQDLQVQKEAGFIAKVDEVSTTLPRNLTVGLGKLNDQDLGSVQVEVSDADLEEVKTILKDPVQRKQLLYNEDGELNIESIAKLLLTQKLFNKAGREGLLEGQDRQRKIVEKTFPARDPQMLGVGTFPSSREGRKGKIASYGKAEPINIPARQK